MRKIAIPIVVAGGLVGLLYWQQHRATPLVVSGFIEADATRVGSRVGGRIAEVSAVEGQRVAVGDVLYRLDPFDLKDNLAEAEAELAAKQAEHDRLKAGYRAEEIEQARARRDAAQATLDRLVAGPRQEEIAVGREELNRATAEMEFAESEHRRLAALAERDDAARVELDRATRQMKVAAAAMAAAEKELALLEKGTRAEEIAEARARLAETAAALRFLERGYRVEDIRRADADARAAAARVAAIRRRLGEMTVESPCDCVVEAIDLHPGDFVAADGPSVSLLDLSNLWVRAYVPEDRLGQVSLNQRVPVSVDSFANRRFAGRITFIARDAEFTPRNVQTPEERSKQVFRIKVTLEEGLDVLRVGMAADVWLDEVAGGGGVGA
jgi:multidrug resistance efflux pump